MYVLPSDGFQNLQLLVLRVCDPKVQHLVESTRAEQCRVEQVGPVGRADDEHTAASLATARHAVQFSEELGNDPVHDAAAVALVAALRRNRVEFIEEDDAGACIPRLLEDPPDIGLGLANVHV